MRLSRTTVYALQATLQLAQAEAETPVPCSRLAAEGGMPERFLLQILRSLVTHGVLESTRGVDGGYRLMRGADEVSLLDVIEAIEGPPLWSSPEDDGLPAGCHAKLQCVLGEIVELARHKLEVIKLADLLPALDGQTGRAGGRIAD